MTGLPLPEDAVNAAQIVPERSGRGTPRSAAAGTIAACEEPTESDAAPPISAAE
jgi:hypothetical protein